ncbi:MAG: endonuclease/exonuclease/phosphatase family protein [Deltaproteobacteria bacterium]|nr:endonuclease/exonuclease/phosphatase family protein [Deltaproteobacteria bacterium]
MITTLFLLGCTPLATSWSEVEEFPIREASSPTEAPAAPSSLRVLTWNVKFGGGRIDFFFDGWDDRVHMTTEEVDANMEGLLSLIEEVQPDILLTQEVDIGSKRSAYVDQVDALLEGYGFNYAAWVPVWQSQYVAEEGVGRVQMGQAVFSRWPITYNARHDLPQPTDQSAVVNYFYLHRAIQEVEIDLGAQGTLTVVNNHPDAYAMDGTKIVQLGMIHAVGASAPGHLILGGDFNVVPPGSLWLSDYPDQPALEGLGVAEVSYTVEETEALLPFYDDWTAAIPLETYAGDTVEAQAPYFSHSISKDVFWTQKLDYLFTTGTWTGATTLQKPGDGGITVDPMALSDHAPLFAVLEL